MEGFEKCGSLNLEIEKKTFGLHLGGETQIEGRVA
jgi:hypothetical protein